jgi:hypothetical protein
MTSSRDFSGSGSLPKCLTEGWRGEEFGLSAFLNRDFLFKEDCEGEGLSPWVDSSESLSCTNKGIKQIFNPTCKSEF